MISHVDTSDRPFGLPPPMIITIDLPFPISTNALWSYGRKNVRASAEYTKWKSAADAIAMVQKTFRGLKTIETQFIAIILIADHRKIDVDNCAKSVLDWAQSRMLIANDSMCNELTIRKVPLKEVPTGARLIIREI